MHLYFPSKIRKMKLPGREGKTAVVVGTITDDVRIQEVPKLKVRRAGARCGVLQIRLTLALLWCHQACASLVPPLWVRLASHLSRWL